MKFLLSLVQQRIEAGISQADVAQAWGVDVEVVRDFEFFGAHDPTLSSIRRYAASIGVIFQHRVQVAPIDPIVPQDTAVRAPDPEEEPS